MMYQNFKTMIPSVLEQWQTEVVQCVSELQQLQSPNSWKDVPNELLTRSVNVAMAYITIQPFLFAIKMYPAPRAIKLLVTYLNEALSKASVLENGRVKKNVQISKTVPKKVPACDAERPKHLEDYLYMLPDSLKKRASSLFDLYLELTLKRNDSERLASEFVTAENNGDTVKIGEISQLLELSNKELVSVDGAIRSFWRDVDNAVEYYKSNNKVLEIDYANLKTKKNVPDFASVNKRPAEFTYEEIESMTEPEKCEFYKTQRINANKKYLRRKDFEMNDTWKKQVNIRFNELIKWKVPITKKVMETARLAGVVE